MGLKQILKGAEVPSTLQSPPTLCLAKDVIIYWQEPLIYSTKEHRAPLGVREVEEKSKGVRHLISPPGSGLLSLGRT